MQTIHIVSHTHWDREWYQPFQSFRLKLVHLVDNLLAILDADPDYKHYMLDGQTIVLEDYLQMRMANLPRLQAYIQENRILIGPWYILPDEFLVSPEATIRNLLIGKRICALFGQRMMVGYIPDPFGHISQMPQILQGFHIDTACLWRGVPEDKPTLVWWQAPDGTQVLLAHLYTSYGNGAHWPAADEPQSIYELQQAFEALAPHNPITHTLVMRGSDHLEPRPALHQHLKAVNQAWEGQKVARHSTLPAYLAAATHEISEKQLSLETITGELRDPRKAHMLPGVLSARMWIKQRNHQAQTLLERWVEPFSTWAELVTRGESAFTPQQGFDQTGRISDPTPLIHQAWKLLISNHPHDSICGCSIDQVHNEMLPRFDQVDQIGEELTQQSLNALAGAVDSVLNEATAGSYAAIQVFNAAPYNQSGLVSLEIDLPDPNLPIQILDESGNVLESSAQPASKPFMESNTYPMHELTGLLSTTAQSGYDAKQLINAHLSLEGNQPQIEAEFSNIIPPDQESLSQALTGIFKWYSEFDKETQVQITLRNTWTSKVSFLAPSVPAFGLRTFWVRQLATDDTTKPAAPQQLADGSIENEFFKLFIDQSTATLTLHDKRSDTTYPGLNAFLDLGDRGDEYNFCPPEQDLPARPTLDQASVCTDPLTQTLELQYHFNLLVSLSEDRSARSLETVPCALTSKVTLVKNCPYVDFETTFDNLARDHRLEVRFPSGLQVETARFDGHLDVLTRNLAVPEADASWRELPRPEVPQRTFADISTQQRGLMLANRGLPEVAVLPDEAGKAEICLTLLRCVGWLSRDDMWVRQGHAGPGLPTPGAQEIGKHTFEYRLIPHDGQWLNAAKLAHHYQTPMRAIFSSLHAGDLPPISSFIKSEPPEFFISAVKPAEDEAGWVVRGVNLADHEITVRLKTAQPYHSTELVYLDESHLSDLQPAPDGSLIFKLGPRHIASVLYRLSEAT